MFYTVYQVTNLANGKIYVGKHQTHDIDDGYLGSGKLLRRAIRKYGLEKFSKQILFVFSTEKEMNAKEAEIVTEAFCTRPDTYNLCRGGNGGWGYINSNNLQHSQKQRATVRKMMSDWNRDRWANDDRFRQEHIAIIAVNAFHAPPEHMARICRLAQAPRARRKRAKTLARIKHAQGNRNSQYGTVWITDGVQSKKLPYSATVPAGWELGRTITLR
jgi:hypothetical protein